MEFLGLNTIIKPFFQFIGISRLTTRIVNQVIVDMKLRCSLELSQGARRVYTGHVQDPYKPI